MPEYNRKPALHLVETEDNREVTALNADWTIITLVSSATPEYVIDTIVICIEHHCVIKIIKWMPN